MKSPARPGPPHWQAYARALLYLAALASGILLLVPISKIRAIHTFARADDPLEFLLSSRAKSAHPDPAVRLLLFGDEGEPDPTNRWHALWMSEPDNPTWFSRHVAMQISYGDGLTPELLETAERIDPENGFWQLVASCIGADDVLEKIRTENDSAPRSADMWIAIDADEVLRRIDMLHQAAAHPILDSRHTEWHRAAIPHMLPADHLAQKMKTLVWLASEVVYGGTHLRRLPYLQKAAVRIAIDREDPELAARVIRDWHRISHALAHSGTTLIDMMFLHLIVNEPIELFHEAASQLGLKQELSLLTPILESSRKINAHREQTRANPPDAQLIDHLHSQASHLGMNAMGRGPDMLMHRPDELTAADHHPTLRMENTFTERLLIAPMALPIAVFLTVFSILWLTSNRAKRRLARQIVHLPSLGTRITIGLAASAGPLLWYLFITRFTSYGWHTW